MPRVTRGFKARRRRNKVLAMASGYRGGKHLMPDKRMSSR